MKKRPTTAAPAAAKRASKSSPNIGADELDHSLEDDLQSDDLPEDLTDEQLAQDHGANWLDEWMAGLPDEPDQEDDSGKDGNGYTGPSRSMVKRHAEALYALGMKLLEQPQSRVDQMMMPPYLEAAIKEARRARGNGGKKRATQYVGKMMRRADQEDLLGDIRKHMALIEQGKSVDTERLHALEALRQRLLDDEGYLTQFMQTYPQADVQQIRTLIRNARKEKEQNKPPKSSRELFQVLKTLVQE